MSAEDDPGLLVFQEPDPDDAAGRLATAAQRWSLTVGEPLPGGFRSAVYAATDATGRELVVKLAATRAEARAEAAALAAWAATGAAVSLAAHDDQIGAMLLGRIRPGTPLATQAEGEAVEIAADLLGRLHDVRVPAGSWRSFEVVYTAFEQRARADAAYFRTARADPDVGRIGVDRLDPARDSASRLTATAPDVSVLHGDFCDKNVLFQGQDYVAIDPIPMVGDPCSDIGFFAAGRPPVSGILERAESMARRLGRDPDRSRRWAGVWAVQQAAQAWRPDQDDLEALVSELFP